MKTNFLPFKKTFVTLLFLSILLGLSNQVKAGSLVGGDISYSCTNTTGVYKVTLKLYRDCSGLPFCPNCGTLSTCTSSSMGLSCQITGLSSGYLGVNYGSFVLTVVPNASAYDIIQTCNTSTSICNNCQTRTAGTFSPGVEVYTLEGEANLSSIPTACCKVGLQASTCCRSNYIQTIMPGSYFITCDLNRCQTTCNSAPVFTNDALAVACNGIDFVYNLGAIDIDGDSLSYAFGAPLSDLNTQATYIAPYSASYLIPFFGAPNANAGYPAGMRIDPVTGDILFRPTSVINTFLVIEVTQWKLVADVWTNVGKTRRDLEFRTLACSSNKIPILKTYKNGVLQNGIQNFVAYAGHQFCIDIVAQDQSLTADLTATDSTDIKWNNPGSVDNTMSNATFTRNYILANRAINGPKADSFKFCWTPPIIAVRSLPHLFTVSGSDRNCPLRAVFTRGITIQVQTPKMVINETTKKVFCNNKTTIFNVNYSANGVNLLSNNVFTVQLSDSVGSFANATTIGTKTAIDTVGFIPVAIPTSLFVNKNYKIRVNCSSDTVNLGTPFAISFVVGFSTPVITNNRDSFCKGLVSTFKVTPNTAGLTFKWLKNNAFMANENKDSLLVDSAYSYRAIVSNAGCSDTSNAKYLTVYPKPIVNFTAPTYVCLKNLIATINLSNTSSINSGTMNYNWKYSDNTNSNLLNPNKTVTDTGNLIVKLIATSNNGCVDSMSKTVNIRKAPVALFYTYDTAQCVTNNYFEFWNQSDDNGLSNQYTWNFGVGNNVISNNLIRYFSYNYAGIFTVKLIALSSNFCADTATQLVVVADKATTVNFTINKTAQCLSNNNFIFTNQSTPNNSSLKYKWDFGNGDTSTIQSPTYHYSTLGGTSVKLVITANNECLDSITKFISVNAEAVASFSVANATQCLTGNNFSFTNSATNSNTQTWSFGDLSTSSVLNPTKKYATAGNFAVKLVAKNNANCNDSITKTVTVNAQPTIGNITGNIIPNSISTPFTYSVLSQANSNYNWFATNGTIQSGQGTNVISILWTSLGAGNLTAKITNNNGCIDSTILPINISVGINNLSLDNDLNVYPNPTKSSITITNKTNLVGKKYFITNIVGQIVISGKLNIDETIINLETLQSGLYLLSIDGMNKQSIKVMKE